jgi:hypothetical protein
LALAFVASICEIEHGSVLALAGLKEVARVEQFLHSSTYGLEHHAGYLGDFMAGESAGSGGDGSEHFQTASD